MLSRVCVYAILIFSVISGDALGDVCDLPMDQLYVPDSTQQTRFPVGYLPCMDAMGTTIPRCHDCDCRAVRSYQNAGGRFTWGVCIEGKNESTCEARIAGSSATLCNVYVLASEHPPAKPLRLTARTMTATPPPAISTENPREGGPSSESIPTPTSTSAKDRAPHLVAISLICLAVVGVGLAIYKVIALCRRREPVMPQSTSGPFMAVSKRVTISLSHLSDLSSRSRDLARSTFYRLAPPLQRTISNPEVTSARYQEEPNSRRLDSPYCEYDLDTLEIVSIDSRPSNSAEEGSHCSGSEQAEESEGKAEKYIFMADFTVSATPILSAIEIGQQTEGSNAKP